MTARRKEDINETRSWFRSDRLFQEGNQWFFLTREGTVEGPYADRFEALRMLDAYVMVMNSSLYTSNKLSVQKEGSATPPPAPEPRKSERPAEEEKPEVPAFSVARILT